MNIPTLIRQQTVMSWKLETCVSRGQVTEVHEEGVEEWEQSKCQDIGRKVCLERESAWNHTSLE